MTGIVKEKKPVIEKNDEPEQICGFCGYKAKTRLDLTTHKKEYHGVI
ncbi:MAG: hypothetical protein WDA42_03470 [Candidatus Bathyarchaeia archaeon]